METIIQENENISLKFDVILLQVTVTCCKLISLKISSTCVVEISRYKIYLSSTVLFCRLWCLIFNNLTMFFVFFDFFTKIWNKLGVYSFYRSKIKMKQTNRNLISEENFKK